MMINDLPVYCGEVANEVAGERNLWQRLQKNTLKRLNE